MSLKLYESCLRERTLANLSNCADRPPRNLQHDRWVLASLLQKSIRRNERDWALAASASLLVIDPTYLWRRLVVIAFEDVSFGDAGLVAEILAASSLRWRRAAGDWAVTAYFVERLCNASKCRAPNNLIEVATWQPTARDRFVNRMGASFEQMLGHTATGPYPDRLLAALSLGTKWNDAQRTDADTQRLVEHLCIGGTPESVFCIVRGVKTTSLQHPVAMALLWPDMPGIASEIADDQLPPMHLVNGIPAYAYDMHTRAGATAIRRYCAESSAVRGALQQSKILPADWFAVVRHCIFDLESGLVRSRLVDPVSKELRAEAESWGFGRTPSNAWTITSAIRSSWSHYSRLRTICVKAQGCL